MAARDQQLASTRLVKAIVLGDSGVGKSSLVLRFVSNNFKPNAEPTIGAAFMSKSIVVGGNSVTYQIWDTAGQERYHSIARKSSIENCEFASPLCLFLRLLLYL